MGEYFDVLYAKVNEFRETIRSHYAGEYGFMVQEDGGVVLRERSAPEHDARLVAQMEAFFFDVHMLTSRFMQYSDLDPHPYDLKLHALGVDADAGEGARPLSAFGALDRAVDHEYMGKVVDLVDYERWRSSAAESFETGFLHMSFFPVHDAQRKALYELAMLIGAYREAERLVQRDLVDILDNGIAALNSGAVRLSGFDVVMLFANIAVLVAFPEVAWAYAADVALFGVGFASQMSSGENIPQSGDYEVAGDDAVTVLAGVGSALDRLEEVMEENDREIKRRFETMLSSTESFANPRLDLPPPPIVGNPDFGHTWATYDPAVPIQQDQVLVSVMDVYEAGYKTLPAIAQLYRSVMHRIDWYELPELSYTRHWRHSSDIPQQVIDRLVAIFRNSSETLVDVGEALVSIAASYDLNDAQNAEYIRQTEILREPPSQHRVGHEHIGHYLE